MYEMGRRNKSISTGNAFRLFFGLAIVLIIGFLDYITGPNLGFFLFYLIPVAFISWVAGLMYGVIVAFIAGFTWLAADLCAREFNITLYLEAWNTLIRLLVFLFVAFALWRIRVNEERQREITEFIVHDLRNPLSAIRDVLGILNEGISSKLSAEERSLLEAASTSCRRAITLVNSILDLSRLESGKMPVSMAEIRAGDVLTRATADVSVYARRSGVAIKADCGDRDKVIYSDRELLLRVLINLLGNAIKASAHGSAVSIRVFAPDPDHLAFSVEDTGPGIPKDMQNKLFGRFSQVGTYPVSSGSGLGLNFCKLAVSEMGGRIRLDSEAGKGTSVVVVLPVKTAVVRNGG
ncbi:MAG: HAMP domain-containing sensor histidine kinase [Candidatus Omnitrophota bacterium]